jgi:hypothetical protein
MRHPCPKCPVSYRHKPDLDEHKRVGCRAESAEGESLIAEPEEAPEPAPVEEVAVEESAEVINVEQEVSLEPDDEPEEKESSPCQELT